ncbi:MAG: alpha/beta fold hydrolase [Bacteroidia bacterium]
MLHFKTHNRSETAPWVVFIHGAGGNSSIWFKQVKAFSSHFNLLLLDLRGHGKSTNMAAEMRKYSFEAIARDVIEVLDHLNIAKAHFVGVSLGTIIIRQLAETAPNRVASMVMAGAISRLDFRGKFFVWLGRVFKNVVPFMWLYKLFAFVIMPRANHAEARNFFIRQAQQIARKEFLRWYKLTGQLTPLLRRFESKLPDIPALYVMGRQDHMFLPTVSEMVSRTRTASLEVIEQCGHVVTIEQAARFNELAIGFLHGQQQSLHIASSK